MKTQVIQVGSAVIAPLVPHVCEPRRPDRPGIGFWFLNTWQVLGKGNKDRNFDMYKKQSGTLLQKLWCNEEALYIYDIIQRAKSCYPKTLPPQAK